MPPEERPFTLFFGGAEVPGWRELLGEAGVHGICMTYMNLRQRIPKKKPWLIADHVPEGTLVLLESGAYTANKDPGRLDRAGWLEYDESYRAFVEANADRIDLVTEFDSLILGPDYINEMRESFWNNVKGFMPVWHDQYGLDELQRLAEVYDQISLPDSSVRSSNRIAAKVNSLTQRYGTKFHGAAVTKPDLLKEVRFTSAHSTSWLSPIQFGDTIVWDGTRLRRYPKKYKDQARKRHRMAFTRAGFDAEKIAAGDPTEVAKFTVWSWLQLEEQVNNRRGNRPFDVIDGEGIEDEEPSSGNWEDELASDDSEEIDEAPVAVRDRKTRREPVTRKPEDRKLLPVFGMEKISNTSTDATGVTSTETTEELRLSRNSLRRCDSCFVSGSCPAFEPGNECAFDLPLEVRTRDQLMALLSGVIEMQAQRVAFSRFAEELEGGYPDPNLSNEMDRLFRLVESMKEITDSRDTLEFSVKAKAGAGVLSRIFGTDNDKAQKALPALPQAMDRSDTDELLSRIVDADSVSVPVTRKHRP